MEQSPAGQYESDCQEIILLYLVGTQRFLTISQEPATGSCLESVAFSLWGCVQKFPDWPPGARTANGRALCH